MKKIFSLFLLVLSLFLFVSCDKKEEAPVDDKPSNETYFDSIATEIDHYFSNEVTFDKTGIQLDLNSDGKLAGDFLEDKVARLSPKSITDGDTAVFHLDKFESGATMDSFTNPLGTPHSYATIRFYGVDTPESTSSIDPWGKAASNYAKSLLVNAEGIIIDASGFADYDPVKKYADRLDSNGSRWLALVWYCPEGKDPEVTSNYRLYQLDLIEECYSRYTGASLANKYVYDANRTEQPILYNRYKETFGSLTIADVMFEAELRISALGKRIHGEIDPNFDYSTEPTKVSIKDALANISNRNDANNYMNKGTLVELTGVITRHIGNNFYLQDKNGASIYVYMGIDGNSIEDMYKVGDTISIRGRLCEYGGQFQMSGVEFKPESFKKVTGENAVDMPEVITLTGNETAEELDALLGKLVTCEFYCSKLGNTSKDGSYSLTDNTWVIPGLTGYYNKMQVRINGTLAPGYKKNVDIKSGKKYTVTGILGIYMETDLQESVNEPSYQIIPGNRLRGDEVVNEVVEIN